ncbi:MAG: hypothetical protein QM809_07850 [Gordonia sp. (in: high G+C Gram-positive bacteria)]|uniref:sensor histidine kinase n=1 Tax=Gordonia sp. (in: high G+C Gram-positive bacteria) TaxID=84139 RepID=UPI0039E288EB
MNVWRIQRAATLCIGVMLLLTPLLSFRALVDNREMVQPWWTLLSVVALIGSGGFLLVVGIAGYRRLLTPAVTVSCGVEIVLLALWFVARTGVLADPDVINPVWVTTTSTMVTLGLALVGGLVVAVLYTGVLVTLMWGVLSYAHAGHLLSAEFLRGMINGPLTGVFLAIVSAAVLVARRVDDDRDRVLVAAATGAARSARSEERARLDAVVRDEVIAVLRTVQPGEPARIQREQAQRALCAIGGIDVRERPDAVTAREARLRLREHVVAHGDHIAVSLDVDGAPRDYPSAAVDALVDATDEALGNSLRHAGDDASQAVVGMFSDEGIRIRVVDDGRGFDPARVPADRMGIEVGIRARMASVPGGSAEVAARRGDGAMVSLAWVRA